MYTSAVISGMNDKAVKLIIRIDQYDIDNLELSSSTYPPSKLLLCRDSTIVHRNIPSKEEGMITTVPHTSP